MKTVSSRKIGEAWKELAAKVLNGHKIKDGSTKLKEVNNICLQLEGSLNSKKKNNKYNIEIFDSYDLEEDKDLRQHYDPKMLDWMRKNFFNLKEVQGWGYSYGQRIFAYGQKRINQLQKITEKLSKNPESKSAAFTLMMPGQDDKHYPCVTEFSFFIRDKKLLFNVTMRSQDIGKKSYADYLCYWDIASLVCEKLNLSKFQISVIINSAHIYEQEWKKMERFIQ